jgi:hypothetical protein
MTSKNIAAARQRDVFLAASASAAEVRGFQRMAQAGTLARVARGVYVTAGAREEVEQRIRRAWQEIAGALVPGGVVSHLSALTAGMTADGTVTLSHPTLYGKTIGLPGLSLVLLRGPGPLPGDLPLGNTGLHWASRPRMLIENLGKKAPRRAGRDAVEAQLVAILAAAGESALNTVRDQAAALQEPLAADKEVATLRAIVGALLGTHKRGELHTRDGLLMAQGTPVDKERMERFELLAQHLRTVALPGIRNTLTPGLPRQHFAFIEAYFSNFVEGTKFDIEQARDIVMNNKVLPARPKDSHDILGVFRLATTAPYRGSPPVTGPEFLESLQGWHEEMLRMRPEARPGQTKLDVNYAGTTRFVEPNKVRGTMAEGSALALSVPEGLARAAYYAFLLSEVHPFEDGNGRLSRLLMNAELSRVNLSRIIVPTLFHPQYVDCARLLTRTNEPSPFVRCLEKMARWCVQFDFSDLDQLIEQIRATNALEESPIQYRLTNRDGSLV